MPNRSQRLQALVSALLLAFSIAQNLRAEQPWAWIDLSPAITNALITDSIDDEATPVAAEPDKAFLIIPIRYDPAGGNRTIGRASFKGRDIHGFYGIRLLPDPPGPLELAKLGTDPIYEKWELHQNATGRGQVTARNSTPPRKAEKEKDQKSKAPRRPAITIPASGWMAIILEIPKSTPKLNFGCTDLDESPLDLAYIRHCREPLPEPPRVSTEGKSGEPAAALMDSLRLIGAKNPPLEALAIRRFATSRGQWSTQSDPEFLARIDRAVLEAALPQVDPITVAVWSYLASESSVQPPVSWITPKTLDRIARATEKDQRIWLDLVASGLGRRKASPAWAGATFDSPSSEPASLRANCTALLTALLRGEEPPIIAAVWDILLSRYAPALDLGFLKTISPMARDVLLDRLPTIRNREFEVQCLREIMKYIDVTNAKRIAAQARRLRIALAQPDDPILAHWEALSTSQQRQAYLQMLASLNLAELTYCPRVAAIIDYCQTKTLGGEEKTAALRFLLRIADMQTSAPEIFSLLIVRTAQDMLVRGLAHVLAAGDDKLAVDAAFALLRRGFAEEAARGIIESVDGSRQANLVQAVLNKENLSSDIRVAFAGFLVRSNAPALATIALDYLSHVAGKVPAPDRWRLIAAARAGINPVELDLLSSTLKGSPATSALRWLHELGHMSAQDRQRLAGAKTPAERLSRLKEIDYRRARVVDGSYGALAIIEVSTARRIPPTDDHPDGQINWSDPRRFSIALPEIQIDAATQMHEKSSTPYRVRMGKTEIGQGVISDRPGIVGGPATFSVALNSVQWNPTSGNASDPSGESSAPDSSLKEQVGPLAMASRKILDPPRPGTMTIDVAPLITSALGATKRNTGIAKSQVTGSWKVTLRYSAFGSFYGVGEARSFSTENVTEGDTTIRNVMIVLERKE